eukprot:Skav209259  [mRNA]  locus=scaffold990:395869:400406:- [translate_table: standard]
MTGTEYWLIGDERTTCFHHAHPATTDMDIMIEACAGIGVVSTGYETAGTQVIAKVEQNQKFVEWLKMQGHENVICANVADNEAIRQASQITKGRGHTLGSGVACQPFSSLGDRQEHLDDRSVALPGTLKFGYYMRSTAILLECTKEAAESAWVQQLLKEFQAATNYSCKQQVLSLHNTWPAKRQRWWCVLLHPAFDAHDIPPMPEHRFMPTEVAILHGLPVTYVDEPATRDPKLTLTGTGQMASPLQGAWIMSTMKYQMTRKFGEINSSHPRKIMADLCRRVLNDRDRYWQSSPTPLMTIFMNEVEAMDHPRVFMTTDEHWEAASLNHPEEVSCRSVDLSSQAMSTPQSETPSDTPVPIVGLPGFETGAVVEASALHSIGPSSTATDHHMSWVMNAPAFDPVEPSPTSTTEVPSEGNGTGNDMTTPAADLEPIEATTDPYESIEEDSDAEICQFFAQQQLALEEPTTGALEPPSKKAKIAIEHRASAIEPTAVAEYHDTITCWVLHEHSKPHAIQVRRGTTVGQLCTAEAQAHDMQNWQIKPTTLLGVVLNITSVIEPEQLIMFRPTMETDGCPATAHIRAPQLDDQPRKLSVWHQRAWMAHDEMVFHLNFVPMQEPWQIVTPLCIPFSQCAAADFGAWFADLVDEAQAPRPQPHHMVQAWFDQSLGPREVEVTQVHVASKFAADCGFQTIAWIRGQIQGHEIIGSILGEEAEHMRREFIHYVQTQPQPPQQSELRLGGGPPDPSLVAALQELIEQHGVNPTRSAACATQLIQGIGSAQIRQTLSSARAWADLKMQANAANPPIKIVSAVELKEAIDKRLQSGQPFGRKDNKKRERPSQKQVVLTADQVAIPPSIFQVNGEAVPQITQHQLEASDRGVIVLNATEALPFLQIARPLNKVAVAVIVVDHTDDRLPLPKEIIKFPATCVATGEAMLVTGAVYQLGRHRAERPQVTTGLKIEVSEQAVIRIQVYRDQTNFEWSTFCKHPVKQIMGEVEFQSEPDAVHDVWDRQFLTSKYDKCKPSEAEVFVVTMRVASRLADGLMDHNAINGKFYERRTLNGRRPAEEYEVVWMPRKSLAETMLLKQTNQQPAVIARAGQRYGLRVLKEHAKQTHDQHRPDLQYIPTDTMQSYRIGPLPFGTTKKALSKIFQAIQWAARPGQPLGQDQERAGMFWSAMASQVPSHWVYCLEHGDILISKLPSKRVDKPKTPLALANVEASRLTMQHLSGTTAKEAEDKTDPWAKYDPWMQGNQQNKSVSTHQLAAIEANVEKRILDSIKPKLYRMDDEEDADMPNAATDQRVGELEQQVQALQQNMQQFEQNVQQFQTQQTAQNQQVSQQLGAVKQQVDAQTRNFQTILDQSMASQMEQIEALLSKRSKLTE